MAGALLIMSHVQPAVRWQRGWQWFKFDDFNQRHQTAKLKLPSNVPRIR